jgi:hypothetical protein
LPVTDVFGADGCPQLNVAAEFPDEDHPARVWARSHKEELRRRLQGIAERLQVNRPGDLAVQLSVVINGGFVSSQVLVAGNAKSILFRMARALIAAAESEPPEPS